LPRDGIVKKDLNGHIEGKSSKTQATTAADISSGGSISSGGASKDMVEFESKKVAPHRYLITLPNAKAGEYGFLPPGAVGSQNAAGSTGKVYSFSLLE
jgi:hypothetical protein